MSTQIKEILSLLDTDYLLVCHTMKCLFYRRPEIHEDIHFAVMGHVEAATDGEWVLNYGIVLFWGTNLDPVSRSKRSTRDF